MKPYPHIPTPCYVLEEAKLRANLEILDRVQRESGAKILLALKGFALWKSFPLVSSYLKGITASGLHEAKLGKEEFRGGEVHVYSPAFKEPEIKELITFADHIIFNSPTQWARFKDQVKNAPDPSNAVLGSIPSTLRWNPPSTTPAFQALDLESLLVSSAKRR